METIKKSSIVFLPNIFIISSRVNTSQAVEEMETPGVSIDDFFNADECIKPTGYIPELFIDWESWIKETDLLCWSCSNTIKEQPWFLPTSSTQAMVEGTQRLAYYPKGLFCDLACVGRFLKLSPDEDFNKWQSKHLLMEIYEARTGVKIVDIPVANSPFEMSKFCGAIGISESEYRLKNMEKLQLITLSK